MNHCSEEKCYDDAELIVRKNVQNIEENIAGRSECDDVLDAEEYLESNGLIGLSKKKYKKTSYINIDSRNRCKKSNIIYSQIVYLCNNPLRFYEDELWINITDNDISDCKKIKQYAKIRIDNVEKYTYTMRTSSSKSCGQIVDSFIFNDEHMIVNGYANIDGKIDNIFCDEGNDLKVEFSGFCGDVKKTYYFDFNDFIILSEKCHESDNTNSTNNTKITIEENVHGDLFFVIQVFVVDKYGMVIDYLTQETINEHNKKIVWKMFEDDHETKQFSLPLEYFEEISEKIKTPKTPISFIDYMQYIENLQNTIRPIFYRYVTMIDVDNTFNTLYKKHNKQYKDTINLCLWVEEEKTTKIGNVPVNFLNDVHKINFFDTDTNTCTMSSSNRFFITLNKKYNDTPNWTITKVNDDCYGTLSKVSFFEHTSSDVEVSFNYYGGVTLKTITGCMSEYTTGCDHGMIDEIRKTNYNVYIVINKIKKRGKLDRFFGGDNVALKIIETETTGYPHPNQYSINFGKIYKNVVCIKMVNSQFPITQKAFQNGLFGEKKNNRFYWQNIDDGNITYFVDVDEGNYTSKELEKQLESKIRKICRPNNKPNVIKFDINTNGTNYVKIKSYDYSCAKIVWVCSLSEINRTKNVNTESSYYFVPDNINDHKNYYHDFGISKKTMKICDINNYLRVKIKHCDHNLEKFDTITIEKCKIESFNGEHNITQIIDDDHYDIVVCDHNYNFNHEWQCCDVFVLVPNKFRIKFNECDSMGTQLGFRNIGFETSITPYCEMITNDVVYRCENKIDIIKSEYPQIDIRSMSEYEIENTPIRHVVNLDGPPYLLIACKEIRNIPNNINNPPIGAFTQNILFKINLKNNSRNTKDCSCVQMAYDTYADTPIILSDVLKDFDKMTLEFLTPEYELYNFKGIDHSFVLKITSIDEQPLCTSLQN